MLQVRGLRRAHSGRAALPCVARDHTLESAVRCGSTPVLHRESRHKLESHEFAISEGKDIAPTHLIDEETWAGITHLPDDVSIRISDHNGHRLALLYNLWG